ncbi:unnamed protein product [Gongylonema pulchrum]|uniref:Acyltransferase 3 domain-containing protein n=1 Tax=Gongylonema pulchrum TaxID=637853 RepID=A0A3P7P3U9_9BILA|nr:unnamed protein product [Gongylonema pulchrum]
MKFLSLVWVIVGHSFAWIQVSYVENVEEYRADLSNSFFSTLITNHTLSVANFFLISATLTSYTWFNKTRKCFRACIRIIHQYNLEKPTWYSCSYWLRFYRHRLIRLWPAYLYSLSVLTFRSSTAMYHSIWSAGDPYVQCIPHWWQNILFINIFGGNECLGWTWYISVEFIFFAFSPIFLLLLRDKTMYGYVLSFTVIITSSVIVGLQLYVNNYPASPLPWTRTVNYDPSFYKVRFP